MGPPRRAPTAQIYDPNPRTDNACAAHGGFAKVYD
jgi:hypothetical protein